MKRLFALIMTVALLLGLAACVDSGGQDNNDTPTELQTNAESFQMTTELAQALEESIPASTTTQGTNLAQETTQAQPKQSATPTSTQAQPKQSTASTKAATTKATQASAVPQHSDLPQLTVRQLHRVMSRILPPIQAIRLTTSWRGDNGTAVMSDSPHPLQLQQGAFDKATVNDNMIYLEFDSQPQSLEVRRWPAAYLLLAQDEKPFEQYETVTINQANFNFEQVSGDYIYEVIARWANGTIHYAFRATTSSGQ